MKIKKRRLSLDQVKYIANADLQNDVRSKFTRPTKLRLKQPVCKIDDEYNSLDDLNDNIEHEMKFKKRDRLYSKGIKVKRNLLNEDELSLYDKKGYLLPAKTLSEYIYQMPSKEECDIFIDKTKNSLSKYETFIYYLKMIFINNAYFQNLFPIVKEQKPGRDLYTWIALVQFATTIFLIPFYTRIERAYTNEATDDFSTNQFSGTMVIAVFTQIGIIIFDRYLYLSRMFIRIDKHEIEKLEEKINEENAPVTQSKSLTSLNRISSFNLNNSFISNYMRNKQRKDSQDSKQRKSVYGGDKKMGDMLDDKEEPEENEEISLERGNSHKAIMMKYYFLLFMLILIHYLVFWYFPNKGNQQIQGNNYCNYNLKNSTHCNEVRMNWALFIFYLLY